MEPIALGSLIVSVLTALGVVIHQIHLKNCDCFCIHSDCRSGENSPVFHKV
jgi:hypothetical protein